MRSLKSFGVLCKAQRKELRDLVSCPWVAYVGLRGGDGPRSNQGWQKKCLGYSLKRGELVESFRGMVGRLISWSSFYGVRSVVSELSLSSKKVGGECMAYIPYSHHTIIARTPIYGWLLVRWRDTWHNLSP